MISSAPGTSGPRASATPVASLGARTAASVDFVVVDVETTGLRPGEAKMTEIGAVRLAPGGPAEFSALLNPGLPIPAEITALTGITDAAVAVAPPAGLVLPRFLDFAAGGVLAAHNASFDIGFLTAECGQAGLPWPPFAVIDTAILARLVLDPGEVPDRKLATLAAHFRTATAPCHRALDDARATAEVLTALLRRLAAPCTLGQQSRRGHAELRRPQWSPQSS